MADNQVPTEEFCNRHDQSQSVKGEGDINRRKHIAEGKDEAALPPTGKDEAALSPTGKDEGSMLQEEPEVSILNKATWKEQELDGVFWKCASFKNVHQSAEDPVSSSNTKNDIEYYLRQGLGDFTANFSQHLRQILRTSENSDINLGEQSAKDMVTLSNNGNNMDSQQAYGDKELRELNGVSENSATNPIEQSPTNLVALSNIDNNLKISDNREEFQINSPEGVKLLELKENNKNSNETPAELPGKYLVAVSDSDNNPEICNFLKKNEKMIQDLVEDLQELNEIHDYSNIGVFPIVWDDLSNADKRKISDHATEENTGEAPTEQFQGINEDQVLSKIKQSLQDLLIVDAEVQLATKEELERSKTMIE